MITAVDTSVLVDFFRHDKRFGTSSRAALSRCSQEGSLVACALVWAEVAAAFSKPADALSALERLGVDYDAVDREVALAAGAAWRHYRNAGGSRQRVLADFLIGAHASMRASRLLTRDRGYYRSHFPDLQVVEPGGLTSPA